jgi:hypothetical protein
LFGSFWAACRVEEMGVASDFVYCCLILDGLLRIFKNGYSYSTFENTESV